MVHNKLSISSRDMDLHGCIGISYLTDSEAVWNIFHIFRK
jgi:hypothetical protein